jgi:peptidyl-prolyl cis-trans isomerase C
VKTSKTIALLLPLAFALGCADSDPEGVLARAGDHAFTVDEAVRLLAGQPDLPNEPQVAAALAELWVDYTLLASTLAEDSTLESVDLVPVVQGRIDQEMIFALRDSLIRTDTVVSEEEIRERFRSEAPGAQVRARHILLGFPLQATDQQRDSVRREVEELRSRILAGEEFEALARQFSQDPGSAANGGDLGFFGRNDMVEPFAVAAFALEPGEISEVVQTPMGYHVIRTDEKEVPTFEDVAPQFRQQVLAQRLQQAESLYVAQLEEEADIRVLDDVASVARRVIEDPGLALSRRARDRVLVNYDGGELTVGELRMFMQSQLPEGRARLAQAPDSVLTDDVLPGVTQRELLVSQARAEGFAPPQTYVDSLVTNVREQLVQAADALSLRSIEPQGSESQEQAIDRAVEELLRSIVSGGRDVIPLGAVSTVLRERTSNQVFVTAADAVVLGVAAVRGPTPPPPAPTGAAPVAPPTAAPDTGASGG